MTEAVFIYYYLTRMKARRNGMQRELIVSSFLAFLLSLGPNRNCDQEPVPKKWVQRMPSESGQKLNEGPHRDRSPVSMRLPWRPLRIAPVSRTF